MGFRFSKSIRLGKNVRLNISKSGLGVSGGIRGARISTGPRGSRLTTGIPGTGMSYSQSIGGHRRTASKQQTSSQQHAAQVPKIPTPGLFAPSHEKAFYRAVKAFQAGKTEDALKYFVEASQKDVGAGIFAALLLAQDEERIEQAITSLEAIVTSDAEFPTPLMRKYLDSAKINLSITDEVKATVPIDGLGASLLLAELYQKTGRLEEAIGVLEELDSLVDEPALTLSLSDLYAATGSWDSIIKKAEKVTIVDDVTLETTILRGRAMQEKGLHEAAVAVFTEALKKKKDRDQDLLNEALYCRAISYDALGKKSQSNKDFQKLYAEAPNFRDVATRLDV